MMRGIAYLLSLLVLALAAFVVPMPLVEFSPGGATSIPPLIEIEQVDTTPIRGDLSLLTIRVSQPTLAEAVRAGVTPVRDLVRREQVIPAGVDNDSYFDLQRSEFQRAFEVAVAVGLRAAGRDVEISTAPLVQQVLSTGPAGGVLSPGDLVETIDGQPVATAEELIEAAQGLEAGDTVTLEIDRAGEQRTVEVTAGRVPGLDHPGIGVGLSTASDRVALPFPVELSDTSIGGPSAGMMVALTVYDLVAAEDLAAGRDISGTGTISPDGRVGPIGGIEEKVIAASDAGASIMLIPAGQESVVRTVAPEGLRIVPVATLTEAIAALRTRG